MEKNPPKPSGSSQNPSRPPPSSSTVEQHSSKTSTLTSTQHQNNKRRPNRTNSTDNSPKEYRVDKRKEFQTPPHKRPPLGSRYPMALPLTPVTDANKEEGRRPDKIPKIFLDDVSRSSMLFDDLSEAASRIWSTDNDVPADWATSDKFAAKPSRNRKTDFNPNWGDETYIHSNFTHDEAKDPKPRAKKTTTRAQNSRSTSNNFDIEIDSPLEVAGEPLYWESPDGSANPVTSPPPLPEQYVLPDKQHIINVISENDPSLKRDRKTITNENKISSIHSLPGKSGRLAKLNSQWKEIAEYYPTYKWSTIEIIYRLLDDCVSHFGDSLSTSEQFQLMIDRFICPGWPGKTIGYLREHVKTATQLLPLLRTLEAMCRVKPDAGSVISFTDLRNGYSACERTLNQTKRSEVKELLRRIKEVQSITGELQPHVPTHFDSKAPPSEWVTMIRQINENQLISPTYKELFSQKDQQKLYNSLPNLGDVKWTSDLEEEYRRLHFHLLRAEFIDPLRQLISVWFESSSWNSDRLVTNSMKEVFFEDVCVDHAHISASGRPVIRVSFKPNNRVDWTRGEHLSPGSFVVLGRPIKDARKNLQISETSMVQGMVEEISLSELTSHARNLCYVGLHFDRDQLEKLDFHNSYVMFSSNLHFPTIKTSLEWMKSTKDIPKQFPLLNELISCETKEASPDYLLGAVVDLSSILVSDHPEPKVSILSPWPEYYCKGKPRYNVDFSEYRALLHTFRHKISVTMTPLGTPQFNLVKNVILLLHQSLKNRQYSEPILLITKSSRVLDGILEQVLSPIPDLIRCGSREDCDNPVLVSRHINFVASQDTRNSQFRKEINVTKEMISRTQEQIAGLWKNRLHTLTDESFIETSPWFVKEQFQQKMPQSSSRDSLNNEAVCAHVVKVWLNGGTRQDAIKNLHKKSPTDVPESSAPTNSSSENRLTVGPSLEVKDSCESQDRNVFSVYINFEDENSKVISSTSRLTLPSSLKKIIEEVWGDTSSSDLWALKKHHRETLRKRYDTEVSRFFAREINKMMSRATELSEKLENIRESRWQEVASYSSLIGMTAPYASTHLGPIHKVASRVCIVVEASEIPESTLIPCLALPRLEHLVMVGDHVQCKSELKSKTAADAGLNLSMFERWLHHDALYFNLSEQTTIRPEIYDLIRGFYKFSNLLIDPPTVKDHLPSVEKLEPVSGMASSVYFLHHTQHDDDSDLNFSCTNQFEADFISRFALYLSQQDNENCQHTTILTPFTAQKLLIWDKLDPSLKIDSTILLRKFSKIQVELIDDYVGQQNEIVIISLASPSAKHKIDWLNYIGVETRVKFALSRANRGLYIFGNSCILRDNKVWDPIITKLQEIGSCGEVLNTVCQHHPKNTNEIKRPEDFDTHVPDGGCSNPCGFALLCGHECSLKCHPISHRTEIRQKYVCSSKNLCNRPRPEGCDHRCVRPCAVCKDNNSCPPCKQLVEKELPCGHSKFIPCSQTSDDLSEVLCNERVPYVRRCHHSVTIPCNQVANSDPELYLFPCKEMVSVKLPCGHDVRTLCNGYFHNPSELECQAICSIRYPCGHSCNKFCSTEHSHERQDCPFACVKKLICGHHCANGCGDAESHTSICIKPCERLCAHGRACPQLCYQVCIECPDPCPWWCRHIQCKKKCGEICDRPPCNVPCPKRLSCGHFCYGLCGDQCPPCKICEPNLECVITQRTLAEFGRNERIYQLPDCGCIFSAEALDLYFKNPPKDGDHSVVKLWECPRCGKGVQRALRYLPQIKAQYAALKEIKYVQQKQLTEISQAERDEINAAMVEELARQGAFNIVGGRWYSCPKGHPYYIGNCGGAMQVSQCPACGCDIGGIQHRVVEGNRFYGEFDGSNEPAWPQRQN